MPNQAFRCLSLSEKDENWRLWDFSALPALNAGIIIEKLLCRQGKTAITCGMFGGDEE